MYNYVYYTCTYVRDATVNNTINTAYSLILYLTSTPAVRILYLTSTPVVRKCQACRIYLENPGKLAPCPGKNVKVVGRDALVLVLFLAAASLLLCSF